MTSLTPYCPCDSGPVCCLPSYKRIFQQYSFFLHATKLWNISSSFQIQLCVMSLTTHCEGCCKCDMVACMGDYQFISHWSDEIFLQKKMQNNFHLIETQNALTNVPRIPKTKRQKVKIVNAWLILSCLQNSVKWNIALLEIIEKFWGPEWGFSWLDDPKYDTWDRADWYEDDLEAVKNQVYYWIQ